MITKDVLYSSPASPPFLFHCSSLFHPFCFPTVPSVSLWLPPSQSILNASLLLFAPSEVSDWWDCRPCFGYNAQQVNTHRSGCISEVIRISGSFVWVGQVCVYTSGWNSGEGESIPSPSDFLLYCTKLRRKDTPCTEQHTVSHQKISPQPAYTYTLGLMRSLLHAVIPAGEYCEREPILETDRHLYCNSVFPLCYAHWPCSAQYVFLLECGQSTYLSRQVSFVYWESRMAEERAQSTEAQDRRFWLDSTFKTVEIDVCLNFIFQVPACLFPPVHQSVFTCTHDSLLWITRYGYAGRFKCLHDSEKHLLVSKPIWCLTRCLGVNRKVPVK